MTFQKHRKIRHKIKKNISDPLPPYLINEYLVLDTDLEYRRTSSLIGLVRTG